jgi:uncharacterized protein GlcG (DUF336 family)
MGARESTSARFLIGTAFTQGEGLLMTVTTYTTANITRQTAQTVLATIRDLAGDIAIAKAWTAASWQVSTSYWNRYVQSESVAALQNTPGLMPVGGGYAIVGDGHTIGAVGVSGGSLQQDERASLKALPAMGLSVTPDPDAA